LEKIKMEPLEQILERSAAQHSHLCPRQVLGARIGLAGMRALGFDEPPKKKRLLTIVESDGCFADGVTAATGCTVGHRTLRVEDYGKIAATFVDVRTGRAVRVAPRLDVRERAYAYAPDEKRHYFAQLRGYQIMPDDELLTVQEVELTTPVEAIVSRPGVRVNCAVCGEEIINERETWLGGRPYCHTCLQPGYYRPTQTVEIAVGQAFQPVPDVPALEGVIAKPRRG
jgi:formylmethanofuran dehydrogenase subunit E